MGGRVKIRKNNFMQGTKHETETIQCSMQTTHLETNTLVKQFFVSLTLNWRKQK